jgi:hypothetical protein
MNGKTYKEMLRERIEAQVRWSSSHLSEQQREEKVARLLEQALAPTPAQTALAQQQPDEQAQQGAAKSA